MESHGVFLGKCWFFLYSKDLKNTNKLFFFRSLGFILVILVCLKWRHR